MKCDKCGNDMIFVLCKEFIKFNITERYYLCKNENCRFAIKHIASIKEVDEDEKKLLLESI